MLNNIMLITQAGLNQLQAELAELQNVRRPQLVDRLSIARSMGDLSENSDYQSAKEDLTFVDGKISELEELIRNSKVVVPTSNDTIDFGHTVTVKVGANQSKFMIVGEWEAKPAERKISPSSPLGQSLMGKAIGEKVEVEAPAGKVVYTVVGIE
jgi:transcription elongation factor GreA